MVYLSTLTSLAYLDTNFSSLSSFIACLLVSFALTDAFSFCDCC